MPGKDGKVGQMIAFGADEYGARYVADNFNHLLSMSIDLIEDPQESNPLRRELDFEQDDE